MATWSDMAADNENIQAQWEEWTAARSANGEDHDWGAFREHLMAIGAPDPGDAPEDM